MFLLNYSKDILFLVLAFSVLWATVFITWFFYYLIMAAKEIHLAASGVKRQVDELEEMVSSVKRKITMFSTYGAIAGQIISKVSSLVKNEMGATKARRTKKTEEKKSKHDENASNFMADEL